MMIDKKTFSRMEDIAAVLDIECYEMFNISDHDVDDYYNEVLYHE